jgi:hypothetical protein
MTVVDALPMVPSLAAVTVLLVWTKSAMVVTWTTMMGAVPIVPSLAAATVPLMRTKSATTVPLMRTKSATTVTEMTMNVVLMARRRCAAAAVFSVRAGTKSAAAVTMADPVHAVLNSPFVAAAVSIWRMDGAATAVAATKPILAVSVVISLPAATVSRVVLCSSVGCGGWLGRFFRFHGLDCSGSQLGCLHLC